MDVKSTSLTAVREAAKQCRDCPLWRNATQTVFGEGPKSARVLIVGEQPGDQEDLQGKPFIGPAGKLLDKALAEAGVDRKQVYVTNAVKHFKFEMRGKRRLHKTPAQKEVMACHQWLQRELNLIRPDLVVALGATAARSVFGKVMQIQKNRGRLLKRLSNDGNEYDVLVTVHPSFLLRMPDEDRKLGMRQFVADLKLVAKHSKE